VHRLLNGGVGMGWDEMDIFLVLFKPLFFFGLYIYFLVVDVFGV
jgi:hypothetical protein